MKEQEEIETVKECCTHTDCIYRTHIDGGNTPICYYAVIENQSRNCKISECDKYKGGKAVKPKMGEEYLLFWEYEIYDDNTFRKRY